jgi:hypothetical protein
LHNQNPETHAHAFVYGCEITAEIVDSLSRPKSVENENPELVDRDDEIPLSKQRGLPPRPGGETRQVQSLPALSGRSASPHAVLPHFPEQTLVTAATFLLHG